MVHERQTLRQKPNEVPHSYAHMRRFNWYVCNWERKKYKKMIFDLKKTKGNDNYTAYVEILGKSLKRDRGRLKELHAV